MNEYNRIKNVLNEMTPNTANFAGEIYPVEDVKNDEDLLFARKLSPEYKKLDSDHSSKELERAFTDSAEQGDWFNEEALYADDPDWLAFTTIPTNEIDDNFNHVDTIGLISNELTNHETLPFAIDLTYNVSIDGIRNKFNHLHVRDKKPSAGNKSEFGESWTERTEQGTFVTKTRQLPLRDRYGLKIPGFASVKYFEDTNGTDMLEKGRIDIMPRFVVGFNPELAATLAGGRGSEGYEHASKLARCCTLIELCEQSSGIKKYLEALPEEKVRYMEPKELETAKKQIDMVDKFFQNSMQQLRKDAKNDPELQSALSYTRRDSACQTILTQSFLTYGKN